MSFTGLTLMHAVTGAGSANATAGLLDFKAGVAATQVSLAQTSTLELDQAQTFHGTVAGLDDGSGNALDLTNIAFAKLQPASFTENAGDTQGVLTLTDGTHTAQIALLGNYTAAFDSSDSPPPGFAGFELTHDSGHGTRVTYIAAAST